MQFLWAMQRIVHKNWRRIGGKDQAELSCIFVDIPLPKKVRIISLVPSITELLVDLGLEQQIVGVTKFCVEPAHLRKQVKVVGGTKNIKPEVIWALQPDLIIANKEENIKEQVELAGRDCTVLLTEVRTYRDALEMINRVGEQTNTIVQAQALVAKIELERQLLDQQTAQLKLRPRVLYLIWREPYMTVGGDTFIHDMLEMAGFYNLFAESTRYPAVSADEIAALKPDLILLSSEPYPFKAKHIQELQLVCPLARVILADGQAFSWYGSRMLTALGYLRGLQKL
jgi:ABC-type Fe3+-hydroxamate transport system substrate-binding protein